MTLRTAILEDGKIVAAAPLAAKLALRALTDEWGLQISGILLQNLLDHSKALDSALRAIYTNPKLDVSATAPLHWMHLLLLRQDRFYVAHLGASDIYLIRNKKLHSLAQATSLRQLEEVLGFDFESNTKLETERIACGTYSWPDLPAMHLLSSNYKEGDCLLFTSPGLFSAKDSASILGAIARSEDPFDQSAARLARWVQPRLKAERDGYMLVRILGVAPLDTGEHLPKTIDETSFANQTLPLAASSNQVTHQQLLHQLEFPTAFRRTKPSGGGSLWVGVLLTALILVGWFFAAPHLQQQDPSSVQGSAKSSRTPRPLFPGAAASPVAPQGIRTEPKALAPQLTPPPAAPPAEQATPVPDSSSAQPAAKSAPGTEPTPSEEARINLGRQLALEGKIQESSEQFRAALAPKGTMYTIQLGVLGKPESVQNFLKEAGDGTPLLLFQGKERTFITTGLFKTQKEAWVAVENLPEFFRKQKAVVKQLHPILAESPQFPSAAPTQEKSKAKSAKTKTPA